MTDNWIYIYDNDKIRYVLGEKGKKPLICIGVNSSTAKPNNLDRTLTKVKNISINNKYDGWIMLNLFPLRETKPNNLPKDKHNYENIIEKNIKEIKKIIQNYPNSDILCCWGSVIEKREYLKESLLKLCNEILYSKKNKLKCVDLTKNKQHPRHPLYCKKSSILQIFNIYNYIYLAK